MYVRLLEGCETKARMRADWTSGQIIVASDATGQKLVDAGAAEPLTREEYLEVLNEANAALEAEDAKERAERRGRYEVWCKAHDIEPDTAVAEEDWNEV